MNKMNHLEALTYLRESTKTLPLALWKATDKVVEDVSFQLFPASIDKHHAYVGGLAIHTAEVLEIACQTMNSKGVNLDPQIIIPAVIYHDYGKIYDYGIIDETGYKTILEKYLKGDFKSELADKYWDKVSHRYTIRHPARSYAEWLKNADDISKELSEEISHCILSHHGRVEWQSPVEPQTPEAWTVHISGMLSARWGKMSGKLHWAIA